MAQTYPACRMKLLSGLEKVFPDCEPAADPACTRFSVLRDDVLSFQAAFAGDNPGRVSARVRVGTDLPVPVRVRQVGLVPVALPCHLQTDDNCLRRAPGLYPDILEPLRGDEVSLIAGQWRALWLDVETGPDTPAGDYAVTVALDAPDGTPLCAVRTSVRVVGARLPAQRLIHTEWFHADCLADYYHVAPFSTAHWRIVENFIRLAARRGVNMMLTPAFTPPLDTDVGGERTTVQLVGVRRDGGEYAFDFRGLRRWVELCRSAGIRYIEMAHLFTQWGAKAAPKVMATVDGEYRRLFGWETPAVGGEYTRFLQAYLPALTARLREWGVADRTCFHISDEPGAAHLTDYLAARDSVARYLKDYRVMDALSDYSLYERGAVTHPVPSIDHIGPFLAHGVPDLWTYYCTSQWDRVSNRFIAMPSARNRILGVQLYKYRIAGFLHWGYNFYNAQFSRYPIDPYRTADADGAFPAGDPFLVYPGPDGEPVESIRIMVLEQALHDMRALELLEGLAGRDFVTEAIDGDLDGGVTFTDYPKSAEYLLRLRGRVNREIEKRAEA